MASAGSFIMVSAAQQSYGIMNSAQYRFHQPSAAIPFAKAKMAASANGTNCQTMFMLDSFVLAVAAGLTHERAAHASLREPTSYGRLRKGR